MYQVLKKQWSIFQPVLSDYRYKISRDSPPCWRTHWYKASYLYLIGLKYRNCLEHTIMRAILTMQVWTSISPPPPPPRGRSTADSSSLKNGKSAGVDNIPAELVQADGKTITDILTNICNRIWRTGEWPTPWTQSLIITLPKKATYSPARTTEPSGPSVTRAKPCRKSYWICLNPKPKR